MTLLISHQWWATALAHIEHPDDVERMSRRFLSHIAGFFRIAKNLRNKYQSLEGALRRRLETILTDASKLQPDQDTTP